jgi:hypothetical protein
VSLPPVSRVSLYAEHQLREYSFPHVDFSKFREEGAFAKVMYGITVRCLACLLVCLPVSVSWLLVLIRVVHTHTHRFFFC